MGVRVFSFVVQSYHAKLHLVSIYHQYFNTSYIHLYVIDGIINYIFITVYFHIVVRVVLTGLLMIFGNLMCVC